ncbi:MAG: SpoIIE family protein phosphatase [Anaerolineae bacterium]|nr:SpoIIE family protein phosphatase [Anaerolineae bacterium]
MTRTGHTDVIHRAFKGLDDPAVDMLRHFAVKKTYPANHVLCDEGQVAEALFVIVSGRVVISRNIEGDDDFVLGVLGPGGFFGEMALLTGEARAATVTTIMETDVLEITKEQFEEVFSASPAMARTILQTLAHTITETDRRAIEDLESRNEELARAYAELEAAQADRIERAALEAQLEVAAKAQRSLLPVQLPTIPGFQFAAQFEPARHIGGDFYDVKQITDGCISILVADISDKGAHAALFMAVARALFLSEQHHCSDPADVALAVHRGLLEASNYDMFVTALYGLLDPKTRSFRYVRAGHDEPIRIRQNGDAEFLGGRGRFLGLWPEFEPVFEERQITLEAGDCLVIYSDGVTDMRNPSGEAFGRERLKQVVRGVRLYDAERIAKSIHSGVQRHRDHAEAFDDFTLVVVRAE